MASLFGPAPSRPDVDQSTPEGKAALSVFATDMQLRNMANALRLTYLGLRRGLAGNEQAYAAFEQLTGTGLSAAKLQTLARMVKTVLNYAEAGAISDDVPEVGVTLE